MTENRNILVTGGAGFIGSNTCEALLAKNYKVRCLDNFSTGKKANINHLLHNPNFELLVGDIRQLEICHQAVKGSDVILHLAALGSVPRSIQDPITTNDVNISGFLNILVAARDAGIKRLVYAASSSTYGDSKVLPKVEDVIGKPLSPYAITKYVCELYADIFYRSYGLNSIGLRYFNVFGRRQDPDGAYAAVIPKFIQQLIQHESPVINGTGDFSRDFTYIDNVIQMNLLALFTENSDALNTVYNVAYGKSATLNELAFNVKKYLSEYDRRISEIEVKRGPFRNGDIPHSLASIERAKNLLKYNPLISFEEGLKEAIKWYWENKTL